MSYLLPSESTNFLTSVIGTKITEVVRDLLLEEYEFLPPNLRDEECDGLILITLNDNRSFILIPDVARLSINIGVGCKLKYGSGYVEKNVTNNNFWKDRVNQKINEINILKSLYASEEYASEFGLEFILSNKKKIIFEYIDDEDYLRIINSYQGPDCIKVEVK